MGNLVKLSKSFKHGKENTSNTGKDCAAINGDGSSGRLRFRIDLVSCHAGEMFYICERRVSKLELDFIVTFYLTAFLKMTSCFLKAFLLKRIPVFVKTQRNEHLSLELNDTSFVSETFVLNTHEYRFAPHLKLKIPICVMISCLLQK